MKRIVHIIPTLDRSGAEKQLTLLAIGLPRAEFQLEVITLTRGGPLEADLRQAGISVTHIHKRGKLDPSAFWRLKKHLSATAPDLVQTWLFAANCYGRAAAWAAGVPVIVGGERCVDPWKQSHELFLDRVLARKSARIVVNSSGVSDFYRRKGIPAEKFVVIPNGVELASAPSRTRADVLAELQLPPHARLLGAVGRLWRQKRMDDLIWATDLLKVIRDDVHLLIIGDGPLRDQLEWFRRQVEIEDKVHFLGHRADIPDLLPHFDVCLLSSEYEGLPNVLMEAMAAGVPVVGSDIAGTRDLVINGETGYLVPVGDRAGFARAARRILDDPHLAQRLGAAGRVRMAEQFSVAQMIERFAQLYRELLS